MIAMIWEDTSNCINSIITQLSSKFPREARYYLGKKPEAQELELLSRPPLVFIGWLIMADKRVSVKALRQIEEGRASNIVVIRVNNQDDFDNVGMRLAQLNIKMFDNHRLSKDQKLKWIQGELFCPESTAKYLYNRVGGNLKELVFAVQNLQKTGYVITPKIIRKMVDKNQSAGVLDILEYILGIQSRYVTREKVFNKLYQFRYAESWILSALKDELNNYIIVHKLVGDCKLDILNYADEQGRISDSKIQNIPLWKLKRMILNYGKVSMERMMLTMAMLEKIQKSYFDLIKIIQLLDMGG